MNFIEASPPRIRASRAATILTLLLLGSTLSCARPRPRPAPPPTEALATEEAPPEPPPPPKCETLEEACVAKADTRVPIAGSGLTFEAPEGWTYAHDDDATIVRSDQAVVVLRTCAQCDAKGAKESAAARDEVAGKLLAQAGAAPPPKKKLPWPKRPQQVLEVGKLRVSLWQIDKATRDGKAGPLLLLSAPLGEGRAVTGVGFVAEDDHSNADAAILRALKSLAPAEAEAAAAEGKDATAAEAPAGGKGTKP
jgi:hypothetical protein